MNDKEKLLMDYARMCLNTYCDDCPLWALKKEGVSCKQYILNKKDDAIKAIERWGAEHPVKTRQSEFLKQFPNAEMMGGSLMIMPCSIDIRVVQTDCCNNSSNCSRCRKEYWLQEVENE